MRPLLCQMGRAKPFGAALTQIFVLVYAWRTHDRGTSMSVATRAAAAPIGAPINLFNFAWVALAFAVIAAAIAIGNLWFLNWIHVLAGGLWTGIDLFMGFVVGPILRAAPFEARRAVITRLTPKTLFLMPTLSIVTGTSGWFLAKQLRSEEH